MPGVFKPADSRQATCAILQGAVLVVIGLAICMGVDVRYQGQVLDWFVPIILGVFIIVRAVMAMVGFRNR
jgi:hypothetical protein